MAMVMAKMGSEQVTLPVVSDMLCTKKPVMSVSEDSQICITTSNKSTRLDRICDLPSSTGETEG